MGWSLGSVEMTEDGQVSVLDAGHWYFSQTTLYKFRNIGTDKVVSANTPANLYDGFIECWMIIFF